MIREHIFNSTTNKVLSTPKYGDINNSNAKTSSSSNNNNLNISENICFRLISFVQRKGVQDSLLCRSPTYILLMFQVKTKCKHKII